MQAMAGQLAETRMEAHSCRVFQGDLEGNSTCNWPQSLNTVTCLESSRRKDVPCEEGKSGPVMATLSTAVATLRAECPMLSQKMCPTRS